MADTKEKSMLDIIKNTNRRVIAYYEFTNPSDVYEFEIENILEDRSTRSDQKPGYGNYNAKCLFNNDRLALSYGQLVDFQLRVASFEVQFSKFYPTIHKQLNDNNYSKRCYIKFVKRTDRMKGFEILDMCLIKKKFGEGLESIDNEFEE